jgi:hypothetical protein
MKNSEANFLFLFDNTDKLIDSIKTEFTDFCDWLFKESSTFFLLVTCREKKFYSPNEWNLDMKGFIDHKAVWNLFVEHNGPVSVEERIELANELPDTTLFPKFK